MISYICIVVSLFIPLSCAGYAKFSTKGYCNKKPREFLAGLEGQGARANHAQHNFYETFPAFAIGVLAAHQLGAQAAHIDQLAITYVIARILYAVFYITNTHILRTISWIVAFIAIISLYLIGINP